MTLTVPDGSGRNGGAYPQRGLQIFSACNGQFSVFCSTGDRMAMIVLL